MGGFYVYITASERNGTLYIGMTRDLSHRMQRHRSDSGSKFAKEYDVKKLVYYEEHKCEKDAIEKEKQMKRWKRQWKMRLVDHFNPEWMDLSDDIIN